MGKTEKNLKPEKIKFKKGSVSGKKNLASIPKLDLGFGSRYRNLVSVAHYMNVAIFVLNFYITSNYRYSLGRQKCHVSCTPCRAF